MKIKAVDEGLFVLSLKKQPQAMDKQLSLTAQAENRQKLLQASQS